MQGRAPPPELPGSSCEEDPPHSGWVQLGITPERGAVTFLCGSPQNSEESAWTAPDSPFPCILVSWWGRQHAVKMKINRNKTKFREILCCYSAHSWVIFVKIVDLALCVSLTPISTQKGVFLDPFS